MENWAGTTQPNWWVQRKNTGADQPRPQAKTASVLDRIVEQALRMRVGLQENRYLVYTAVYSIRGPFEAFILRFFVDHELEMNVRHSLKKESHFFNWGKSTYSV